MSPSLPGAIWASRCRKLALPYHTFLHKPCTFSHVAAKRVRERIAGRERKLFE